jgi:dihydropteroate synthase
MGIVNVTPDSFSDGGRFFDPDQAIKRGMRLFEQGADIVDVGGESTRPGSDAVPVDEELRRVSPVVRALARYGRVSIDTRKPEVATRAVELGASIINDVSASLDWLAARLGVGWIAMHSKGDPKTMQLDPRYGDVVGEVYSYLERCLIRARELGAPAVYLDPGIGFGKTVEHNLKILANLHRFKRLGSPILIGVSRKSFLSGLSKTFSPAAATDREDQTLGANLFAILSGVDVIRVHDVSPYVQARSLLDAMELAVRSGG